MSNDALALLGVVGFFALIVGINIATYWRVYSSLPTFDEYR